MSSHSVDPLPSDDDYAAHIAEADAQFERESKDGLLHCNITTRVCHEIF